MAYLPFGMLLGIALQGCSFGFHWTPFAGWGKEFMMGEGTCSCRDNIQALCISIIFITFLSKKMTDSLMAGAIWLLEVSRNVIQSSSITWNIVSLSRFSDFACWGWESNWLSEEATMKKTNMATWTSYKQTHWHIINYHQLCEASQTGR